MQSETRSRLARQQHFAAVGERHRARLVVPAAAARREFLDALRDARRLQAVADVIDRRVEAGVARRSRQYRSMKRTTSIAALPSTRSFSAV